MEVSSLGFRDWGFGVEGLGLIQGIGLLGGRLWGVRVWGFRALRFRDSSFLEFGSFFYCLLFLGVLLGLALRTLTLWVSI